MKKEEKPGLTERFEGALVYATRLHARQNRKRSNVPYIAHLLGVTALVLEDGGDEDEAIAALLHDAVEDQGGLETLEEIHRRFGERVAMIVDALTDAYTFPKPPWRQRKEQYIEAMHSADESIRRVSLADKVYNARATLIDIRREGEAAWKKFKEGKEGTLWYYHQLIKTFGKQGPSELWEELKRVVGEIERVSDEG
ncbi:MAG TPA: HD domain-containing protein [Anaerolineales bacterium]|nr:HD domain-containing protein [Anaerolineales bacterium]